MRIERNDILIVRDKEREKKYSLLKVRDKTGNNIHGIVEASKLQAKRVPIDCDVDLVVTNLGPRPPFGRAYGQLIEPYVRQRPQDRWGEVHYYRRLDKDDEYSLEQAFNRSHHWLKALGATHFLPVTFEIRNYTGRIDGMYRIHPNQPNDLIVLKPKEFDRAYVESLIIHEAGHGIWMRQMTRSTKIRWVRLYTYYVELSTVSREKLNKLLTNIGGHKSIDSYWDTLPEDEDNIVSDRSILDECVDYIRAMYGLLPDHINLLLAAGHSLEKYWPINSIDVSDKNDVIGDYAKKNVEEFFSESLRVFYEGTAPKRIKKLMKLTLANLITKDRDETINKSYGSRSRSGFEVC